MASLMSLLTGQQPGAFEGFQLKDLWDKDRWERREREVQNPRYAEAGLPPQMTNLYKGREFTNPNRLDREMPTAPNPQMVASTMAAPWANAQSQMLPGPAPARPPQNVYSQMAPVRDRPSPMPPPASMMPPQFSSPMQPEGALTAPPRQPGTPTGPAYNRPPPNYIQRTLDTGIPGYFGRPDTVATEEEAEEMSAYRSQMLADLLAETSEEPEVKQISYYKKKKRSPKTWRSKSRGYRLKRV